MADNIALFYTQRAGCAEGDGKMLLRLWYGWPRGIITGCSQQTWLCALYTAVGCRSMDHLRRGCVDFETIDDSSVHRPRGTRENLYYIIYYSIYHYSNVNALIGAIYIYISIGIPGEV